MITYKCKTCGGEMSVSSSGNIVCEYCGHKSSFSDSDLSGYKEFRTNMLTALAAAANNNSNQETTRKLWGYAEKVKYRTSSNEDITIEYIFEAEDDGIKMYMAKESVIYVFSADRKSDAEKFLSNLTGISYPPADIRGLDKFFPRLLSKLSLDDGGLLLAFAKDENMYPLGAFGCLDYRHAAWVLSRLENICCVLAYSDMCHGGISLESIYINPFTHEGALYGGWWHATKAENGSATDLIAIRNVIKRVLGVNIGSVPKPMTDFLNDKPCSDAYTDFGAWDKVIETGLGGRHFHKMEVNSLKKGI